MLLSHHHRFVLIRPLKTASSSIEFALSRLLEPGDFATRPPRQKNPQRVIKPGVRVGSRWFWPHSRFYRPLRIRNHTSLEYVYAVFPQEVLNYKVISMTRNPWDRAVSRFFYHKRRTRMRERDFATQKAAFIRFTHRFGPHTWWDKYWRLKRERSLDNSRRLYFIDGVCQADYVIRVECIEHDLNGLQEFLGLAEQPTVQGIRLKTGTRPTRQMASWMEFYDDATRDLVAECCRWEIEQFGYDFEGKNELKGPYITNPKECRDAA